MSVDSKIKKLSISKEKFAEKVNKKIEKLRNKKAKKVKKAKTSQIADIKNDKKIVEKETKVSSSSSSINLL